MVPSRSDPARSAGSRACTKSVAFSGRSCWPPARSPVPAATRRSRLARGSPPPPTRSGAPSAATPAWSATSSRWPHRRAPRGCTCVWSSAAARRRSSAEERSPEKTSRAGCWRWLAPQWEASRSACGTTSSSRHRSSSRGGTSNARCPESARRRSASSSTSFAIRGGSRPREAASARGGDDSRPDVVQHRRSRRDGPQDERDRTQPLARLAHGDAERGDTSTRALIPKEMPGTPWRADGTCSQDRR